MRASNKYKDDFDTCARFITERVRQPVTNEEKVKCREEVMTSNAIKNILSQWKKDTRTLDLNFQTVLNRMAAEFGEPARGKEWPQIMVMKTDDEAAAWDAAHAVTSP